MLKSLYIKNYALIRHLEIDFENGFSIITGETGAGKSILLGALSLIIGQRADTGVLNDTSAKCIVEACFNVEGYNLESLFAQEDIDFEKNTIVRREIGANGKSRAFVNDVPANLNFLKQLGNALIDIHSQHQTLFLNEQNFQLNIIDTIAENEDLRNEYKRIYKELREKEKEYKKLSANLDKNKTDFDYFQFQFDELEKARLNPEEDSLLESELEALNHSEEIKGSLEKTSYLLNSDEINVLNYLKEVTALIEQVAEYLPASKELAERLNSSYIELKDIAAEVDLLFDKQDLDPERIEFVRSRVDLLNTLCQKHKVDSIEDLVGVKGDYNSRLENITLGDSRLDELKKELQLLKEKIGIKSMELTKSREKSVPVIKNEIKDYLSQLGMPKAGFVVELSPLDDFSVTGIDSVQFLFSANQGVDLKEISKVASGGELSRLMLSLKALVSGKQKLPTIIFDEIDTGVSGEIADKVGNIIKQMAQTMQVFNITHLPQVAAKGKYHYKVFKVENNGSTESQLKLLSPEERQQELAQMLSGEEITEAAMNNAIDLLRINKS